MKSLIIALTLLTPLPAAANWYTPGSQTECIPLQQEFPGIETPADLIAFFSAGDSFVVQVQPFPDPDGSVEVIGISVTSTVDGTKAYISTFDTIGLCTGYLHYLATHPDQGT
jgi:hypothetical protein